MKLAWCHETFPSNGTSLLDGSIYSLQEQQQTDTCLTTNSLRKLFGYPWFSGYGDTSQTSFLYSRLTFHRTITMRVMGGSLGSSPHRGIPWLKCRFRWGFPRINMEYHGIILVVTSLHPGWEVDWVDPRGVCLDLRSLYFREGLNLHRWLHIFWPFEPGTDMGMAFFFFTASAVWMVGCLNGFGVEPWGEDTEDETTKTWNLKRRCPFFSSSERFTINQYYTLKFMEKRVTPFCSFDSVPDSSSWRYL